MGYYIDMKTITTEIIGGNRKLRIFIKVERAY